MYNGISILLEVLIILDCNYYILFVIYIFGDSHLLRVHFSKFHLENAKWQILVSPLRLLHTIGLELELQMDKVYFYK